MHIWMTESDHYQESPDRVQILDVVEILTIKVFFCEMTPSSIPENVKCAKPEIRQMCQCLASFLSFHIFEVPKRHPPKGHPENLLTFYLIFLNPWNVTRIVRNHFDSSAAPASGRRAWIISCVGEESLAPSKRLKAPQTRSPRLAASGL